MRASDLGGRLFAREAKSAIVFRRRTARQLDLYAASLLLCLHLRPDRDKSQAFLRTSSDIQSCYRAGCFGAGGKPDLELLTNPNEMERGSGKVIVRARQK